MATAFTNIMMWVNEMKMYTEDGNVIEAKACPYPIGSSRRGHIWDYIDVTVNNVVIIGKIEVEWGKYAYFIYNGRCYKVSIWDIEYDGYGEAAVKLFTSKDCTVDDVQYEEELFVAKFIRTFEIWHGKRYYAEDKDDIKAVWNEVENSIDYRSAQRKKQCLDFESFMYVLKNPTDLIVKSLGTLFRVKNDERLISIVQKGL